MMYNFTHLHPSAVNQTDYFYDPIYRLQFRCKTWIVPFATAEKAMCPEQTHLAFQRELEMAHRFNLYYIPNTLMNNQGSEYNLILFTFIYQKKHRMHLHHIFKTRLKSFE